MSYVTRRERLLRLLDRPALLFAGGEISRNYPANPFAYRADSSFLYFFSRPEPGAAAFFDPADLTVTLFLPRRSVEDALWHGVVESFEEAKERHGVHRVVAVEDLEAEVEKLAKGRPVDAVAVADGKATARARAITKQDLAFDDAARAGRHELLMAIARLRLLKDADELRVVARTAAVTRDAHVAAMAASKPGATEQLLAGLVEGTFARSGCTPAYGTICSVRGEVLHNHSHRNTLQKGDVVLLDAGAEDVETGLCSDVTRAWPVGGGFSAAGRDVYDTVLRAELAAIDAVKPGVRFRDLHLLASKVLAEGLVSLGLLMGSPSSLVESGAHALFFPHGLGHQIGVDVHDLETFGDRVHYPNGRTRSTQFGTCYLRMDMDLEAGMTFTIEPGLYFVPAILRNPEFREQFKGQVDFNRAEQFLAMNDGRGFGGIRIEDDVLCTSTGVEVLTAAIPKLLSDVEPLVGTA